MDMRVDSPHDPVQSGSQSPHASSRDGVEDELAPEPMTCAAAQAHGIPLLPTLAGGMRPAGYCCDRATQLEGSQCQGCGAPVGPPEGWLLYGRQRQLPAPTGGVEAPTGGVEAPTGGVANDL
jgi:hypothetical protein